MADVLIKEDNIPLHQRSHGSARLTVKCSGKQTRVADLYQKGCAKLRLPTTCSNALQAVMINSSGGLTGGDELDWSFELEESTSLTVTTQACERIYAASSDVARTKIKIDVDDDAKLAWLPQETILFDQGAFEREIDIDLSGSAQLLLVEPLIFGRRAMNETVQQGFCKDRWRIRQNGKLLHAEDTLFEGDIEGSLNNLAVTNGGAAFATVLLIAPHSEFLVSATRTILGGFGGASHWNGKLLARIVCEDSYHLRNLLVPLISLMNDDAPLPKIWAL